MEHADWTLAWSEEMGFGIPELDAADQRLIALTQTLNQAIAGDRDGEEVRRMLDQLLLEAVSHFAHEERVLSEIGYPLPKGHAALHRQMLAELEHAMEALRLVQTREAWTEYGLLVTQLVVEHFRLETIQYRRFLRSNSLSDPTGT